MQPWGFGWCAIQLPVMVVICMNWPDPQITLYSVDSVNNTATITTTDIGLSPCYLLLSFFIMVFGMITMQMKQSNVIDNTTDFSNAILETYALWNAIHWAVFILFHALIISQLATPVDLYSIAFLAIGQYITLHQLCKPRDLYRGYENMAILAYFILCSIIYHEMHVKKGLHLGALCLTIIADMLLVTGHAYDEQLNTEVIGNCRLFYACAVSTILVILYFSV